MEALCEGFAGRVSGSLVEGLCEGFAGRVSGSLVEGLCEGFAARVSRSLVEGLVERLPLNQCQAPRILLGRFVCNEGRSLVEGLCQRLSLSLESPLGRLWKRLGCLWINEAKPCTKLQMS